MAAFTLNSETHTTVSTLQSQFDFLSDFKNFSAILPEDKVENFTCSGDQCSFSIKGITPLTIRLVEKKACRFILFSSEGLAKFNFSLKVDFVGEAAMPGQCTVHLMGDLNPFILNMARKPLEGLANTMAYKLSQLKL